jgi:hypothetical protein
MERLKTYESLSEFLGEKIVVPELPKIPRAQIIKLEDLGLETLFLPAIDLKKPYLGWQKPLPEVYWEKEIIQRLELPSCWVAIETCQKPDFVCRQEPDNSLTTRLGLETRFDNSWQKVMGEFMPKVAKIIGIESQKVRLPSASEWNFIANLFLFLEKSGKLYPDWGATRSWEWCVNKYGREHALMIGNTDFGGISALGWKYNGDPSWFGSEIWWRPIVILNEK